MVLGLVGFVAFVVVLAFVGLVAAGIVAAVQLARRSKADYDAGNVTIPGRSGAVPDSWGGSHDAEAVLHRRLVAAMDALRANQAFDDDGGLLDLRVELEQQALALDQRLVAIAPLPVARKAEPLSAAAADVDRIETAVADLATRSAAEARPSLDAATDRLKERTDLISEAMADLDDSAGEASSDATAPSTASAEPPTDPAAGPGTRPGPIAPVVPKTHGSVPEVPDAGTPGASSP